MSDPLAFMPPRVPPMSAARARDVARAYEALANQLAESVVPQEAARALRDSQWWMTYSIALSQTKGGETPNTPPA